MMTKEELMNEIQKLENRKFFLAMKDRWDCDDYIIDRELFNKICKLKEELAKMA